MANQPEKISDTASLSTSAYRLEKLRGIMSRAGLDATALVPGPYIFYLTGVPFQIASRPLLMIIPAEGDPGVIVPALEYPRFAERKTLPLRYFTYSDAEGYDKAFQEAWGVIQLAGKRIGVEGLKMRVLEGQALQRHAPGASIEHAEDALMWLRIHKEHREISAMRRAIAISEAALEGTLTQVKPGMTERQILTVLLSLMAESGGGENAFDPVVLSGPNSALPHGHVTTRPIREGDLLLFDFGAKIDGYAADITRVVAVGAISDELRRIYETVLAANMAAIGQAAPGVPCEELDRAARRVITNAGYGDYFIHRTGHGLGLDVHEGPYIREGNPMMLEPGMVFTVEPGIYLPGVGGVRIEDDVLVTPTGAEVLTRYPKTLRTL